MEITQSITPEYIEIRFLTGEILRCKNFELSDEDIEIEKFDGTKEKFNLKGKKITSIFKTPAQVTYKAFENPGILRNDLK